MLGCCSTILQLLCLVIAVAWALVRNKGFIVSRSLLHLVCLLAIQIETGLLKELFSTGHQMEPLIVKLSDNRLALTRDESTIFIDSDGNPTQKVALSWSSTPTAMGNYEALSTSSYRSAHQATGRWLINASSERELDGEGALCL